MVGHMVVRPLPRFESLTDAIASVAAEADNLALGGRFVAMPWGPAFIGIDGRCTDAEYIGHADGSRWVYTY